jgi:hypothetical protein
MPSEFWLNRRFALKFAVFVLLGTITWVFYIDLCNLFFRCGCRSLWAGAAELCNIHQKGMKHCPVCMLPTPEYLTFIALILSTQGYFIRREKWLWAILAFPVVAGIEALALGLYRGYWS